MIVFEKKNDLKWRHPLPWTAKWGFYACRWIKGSILLIWECYQKYNKMKTTI